MGGISLRNMARSQMRALTKAEFRALTASLADFPRWILSPPEFAALSASGAEAVVSVVEDKG
jgi:hypothetical protein